MNCLSFLGLNLGEEITYKKMSEIEIDPRYPDIEGLKSAERYRANCKRIKQGLCIYCNKGKIKILEKPDDNSKFKCQQCRQKF